ncbi:MAG: UDP-N-acetylmuramoyl-L-alanyl-D-glutamate--2,6-diaminopimelate ligase [Gammaproteobacteria bacterium]
MSAFRPQARSLALGELLAAAGIGVRLDAPGAALRVTGVCDDSRIVSAGDIYLALRGAQADGRVHIAQAIEAGAVAVLAEADDSVAVDSSVNGVPVIAVPRLRALAGVIAAQFHGVPSRRLAVVAVTGTNGKTTTSWLVAQALEQLGCRAAVMGTLGVGAVGNGPREPLRNTTPGAVELQSLLAGLADAGYGAVAMEASSIGIEQHRLAGTELRAALFTNLSRDHLDYHGTMEAYAEAKAPLFSWPGLDGAVLNGDDPHALQWLASGRVRAGRVYTYGAAGRGHDIELLDLAAGEQGSRLALRVEGQAVTLETRLLGGFNAANLMAVIGALRVLGYPLDAICAALGELRPPAGRMESFGGGHAPLCVVDYAHSPDALEKVLGVLRERSTGALWCVFGCGGDRDRGKRAQMGAIAARLADMSVITSDNPRSEAPQAIVDDILAGMKDLPPGRVRVVLDRADAIARAVQQAGAGDTVLVAGKGHEDYQEIAGVRLPFSDRDAVVAALAARAAGGAA